MQYSGKTFLFITALIGLALFLGGFRLGKKVEMIDKSYVSPTPIAPTRTPTVIPTDAIITFKSFAHAGCGVEFLYPSDLKHDKNSSTSATFTSGVSGIMFDCDKNIASKTAGLLLSPTIVQINNKKISFYPNSAKTDNWTVRNPLTGRIISFTTLKNLTDLVMKTLEFTRKTPQ
ncbi:hypothetical protein A2690_00810 [Candidatus Roizmanbacteria bacterium RIFCSPHIGHO2_01_FULL_39_12b]|uniref:Uncharacterized protein n=1 Tax=Candidatus Roizmanbacteria bacterium RIFCSPHIGHO2_01_FULL_39_12b TaxID=1802030 RepID=A0A1F7GAQ2_9BACT|nr:MAG: hypothetical protein A2690_00810 [Candidatus Roizmanbacteria bacterium RIFCSPHIGHO2_01_FULL_39_12b]